MTPSAADAVSAFGHSAFVIDSSFGFRHSSFPPGDHSVSLDLDFPKTTHADEPRQVLPLEDPHRDGRRLAWRMVPGFVTLLIVGVLVFRFGGAVERDYELSVSRCVFTAVNAITLTGFQQDIRISER